jgi:hypothetical protein
VEPFRSKLRELIRGCTEELERLAVIPEFELRQLELGASRPRISSNAQT